MEEDRAEIVLKLKKDSIKKQKILLWYMRNHEYWNMPASLCVKHTDKAINEFINYAYLININPLQVDKVLSLYKFYLKKL